MKKENKKRIWYAVQKDPRDAWDWGSFDFGEAVEMCKADSEYQLIVAIDGDYDENGNACSDTIAIAEYYKGEDF